MNESAAAAEGPGQTENATEGPRDLRKELAQALRQCTPAQRIWLRVIPDHNFQAWGAAKALKLSSHTVWKWMRDPKVKLVRQLQDDVATEDYDITHRRILAEYTCIAFSDLRDAFDESGKLKSPDSWSDELAAAVAGVDTQERRLRDSATGETNTEFELVRKIKVHDKLKALEFLADFKRMAGAKKLELTGSDGKPLANGPSVVNVFIDGDAVKPSAAR